jgi:hypothetical protein
MIFAFFIIKKLSGVPESLKGLLVDTGNTKKMVWPAL